MTTDADTTLGGNAPEVGTPSEGQFTEPQSGVGESRPEASKPKAERNQGSFTQEQVNKILAAERRKFEEKTQRSVEETTQRILDEQAEKIAALEQRYQSLAASFEQKEQEARQALEAAKKAQRDAKLVTLATQAGVRTEAVGDITKLIEGDDDLEEKLKKFLEERPYYLDAKKTSNAPTSVSRISATNPASNSSSEGVLSWHPLIVQGNSSVFGGADK